MLLALTIAAAVQATSEPKLTVSAVPRGYAITTDEFRRDDFDGIVDRQKKLAVSRCGTLPVRWGKFTYDTVTKTVGGEMTAYIKNYRQGFNCVDPATDPYKPAPPGWKATDADNAAAMAFTGRYFTAFDRGDVTTGLRLMEPILELDRAQWLGLGAGFRGEAGQGARTFSNVEWLVNDPDLAHPGIYARVWFTGTYSGLAAYCGYMLFYRETPTNFYVSQQSTNMISRQQVANGQISESNARKVCGQ